MKNYEYRLMNPIIARYMGWEKFDLVIVSGFLGEKEEDRSGCWILNPTDKFRNDPDLDSIDMESEYSGCRFNLRYHKSWDDLIRVLQKIIKELSEDSDYRVKLQVSLLSLNIEELYETIYNYIIQYGTKQNSKQGTSPEVNEE